MPDARNTTFIGTGIYAVPEASRLTGVSSGCIRRWLRGYTVRSGGSAHASPPVWAAELPAIEGKRALGFLDLIEIRFVNAFRNQGVSWPVLRKAAGRAKELVGSSHPFSTHKFRTDGRRIFLRIHDESGEEALIELTKSQHYFERIITPYLRDLDFDGDEPCRWWPLGIRRRQIVIDPARSFGQPILAGRGIPTAVLAQAVKSNGSVGEVARWYEADVASVRAAVAFEQRLLEKKTAA